MNTNDISFLTKLEDIIRCRLGEGSTESYTARLVASGDKRVAQKVGEEAVELALAATSGDKAEQLEEAADLVFHLLVLLNSKNLTLGDVATVLEGRHSGRP
jgi:phosphoribosyl-ATP pyrophosphohydrolase/phosphoribosyl-AMP cyclohydrolase